MTLASGLRRSVLVVIMAAALLTSCSPSTISPSQTGASHNGSASEARVLFIGNSLTEANGLPTTTQMPADRARLLQEAAQEANAQVGRR